MKQYQLTVNEAQLVLDLVNAELDAIERIEPEEATDILRSRLLAIRNKLTK